MMVTAAEDDDAVQDAVIDDAHVRRGDDKQQYLAVTIRENDTRGVTVTPTSLEVPKMGKQPTLWCWIPNRLATDNVTVTISGASGDVTLDAVHS